MKPKIINLLLLAAAYASALPSVSVRDLSGHAQTNVPITFGQAFPPGTHFAGLALASGATVYPTQVDVKRTYDDGSAKYAIVSAVLPTLAANQSLRLTLRDSVSFGGAPVAIGAAETPDLRVQITDASGFARSLTLREMLSTPTRYWLRGPVVTEVILAGPPHGTCGKQDSGLEVQFHVRYYPLAKAARVSVIVDNMDKARQGNVTYSVRILNGTDTLYARDNLEHFHNARWKKDFTFGSSAVQVDPDLPYLISTGLLPRYDTTVTPSPASLVANWTRYQSLPHDIMGSGLITRDFGNTGGREDIGMYPGWVARYLLSRDTHARDAMFGTADLAGSVPLHYRDTKDKYLISVEDYPTVTLLVASAEWSRPADKLPAAIGPLATNFGLDCSHMPSVAYVPYLLSGDLYYLQEHYQWTNYCIIEKNFEYRSNELGLVHSDQVRGQAWILRNIADAAAIAPDADREKGYYDRILKNNLKWYDTAIAVSPLGAWGPQTTNENEGGRADANMDGTVRDYTSPWMTDFLTLVFDHVADVGYPAAKPIRDHLLKGAIGRVTNGPAFNPYDGAPYHLAFDDMAGKQFTDWPTVWQKSFQLRAASASPRVFDPTDCTHGYPYILRATLTAAAREGLPKGKEAFDFMDSHLDKKCLSDVQTWAIVPGGVADAGIPPVAVDPCK